MTITINGTTGIAGVDGSASTPAVQGADTNTGIFFGTDTVTISTGGTAAVTVDSGQRTKFPTTIGVGGATPSTSGSGISFPATVSASSDANTLDDYEEGAWTPTITYSTSNGDLSYSHRVGTYTKVGRQVTCLCRLTWTETTASGNIQLSGLPFASANNSQYSGHGIALDNMTSVTGGGTFVVFANVTTADIYSVNTGTSGSITNANTGTNSSIWGAFTYFI